MSEQIKFGTDGWRGIIADDFTFDNVRRAAGAIASYVIKNEDPKKGILIGYDTRFGSKSFAHAAAETIAAAGIPVRISNDVIPTTIHVSAALAVKNDLLPALEQARDAGVEPVERRERCVGDRGGMARRRWLAGGIRRGRAGGIRRHGYGSIGVCPPSDYRPERTAVDATDATRLPTLSRRGGAPTLRQPCARKTERLTRWLRFVTTEPNGSL